MSRGLQRALVILLAFAALEAATRSGLIDEVTMIPPSEWLLALTRILRAGSANADILFTSANIALATAISFVGGVLAGLALYALPRLRHAVAPILASYYAVPVFALYPLLIGVFGINAKPLVAIGAMFGIVAMVLATLNGLDRVPTVYLKAAAAHGLGYWPAFFSVRLPAMLPHLMSGFKLAVAYSVIGVIAGEFILSSRGLGRAIAFAYNNFDNPTMYGLLLLVVSLTIAVNLLLSSWEQAIYRRWQR